MEEEKEFIRQTVKFNLNKKPYKFEVVHNLTACGLSLEAAFYNWVYRTKEHTVENFCDYAMSKDSIIKCYPAENYDKLTKK